MGLRRRRLHATHTKGYITINKEGGMYMVQAHFLAEVEKQVAKWQGGKTFLQTRDQRGDGFDIACAPHADD